MASCRAVMAAEPPPGPLPVLVPDIARVPGEPGLSGTAAKLAPYTRPLATAPRKPVDTIAIWA